MSRYVFLGPSLPVDEAHRVCAAIYLPPARFGDVWRACTYGGASAIAIIDGYFERVPAVWHKEILWALANGIPVAGAASMGALRAAELAPFGMVGIGRIFEAFRSGTFAPFTDEPFEDDDEVAVIHGPAEADWLASEAMVNIRATLAAAADAAILTPELRDTLARLAKSMFYKDRSWPTLLRRAAEAGLQATALAAFRAWLPKGRVDQKRLDALALLHWLEAQPTPAPDARFTFADTTLWRRAVAGASEADDDRVLRELRLTGMPWRQLRDEARAGLSSDTGESDEPQAFMPPVDPDPEQTYQALVRHADWVARQHDRHERLWPLIEGIVLARLRANAEYERLLARARAKERLLSGSLDTSPAPSSAELIAWFVAKSPGNLPSQADTLARWLDLPDAAALVAHLLDEYRFVRASAD